MVYKSQFLTVIYTPSLSLHTDTLSTLDDSQLDCCLENERVIEVESESVDVRESVARP